MELVFRFEIPDRDAWVGRKENLRARGSLVYPYHDVDEALVGAVLGSGSWEEQRQAFDASCALAFTAGSSARHAAKNRDQLWNIVFAAMGVLAVVLAFLGARHLPDTKDDTDGEGAA